MGARAYNASPKGGLRPGEKTMMVKANPSRFGRSISYFGHGVLFVSWSLGSA